MNATTYKTVTENVVIAVAEKLMYEFKGTSTLEVKNQLRKDGYFAKQDEISRMMDSAYLKRDWNFEVKTTSDNRQYRVYELKDPTQIPDSLVNDGTASTVVNASTGLNVVSGTAVDTHIMRDGRQVYTIAAANVGDWEVGDVNSVKTVNFPGHFTRDEVRNAYAILNKVKKETTRAHKVK